jgi:hypothetical protein
MISMRRVLAVAIALATMLTIAFATSAPSAHAESPILYYEGTPDNTQAGGHPDVFVRFGVANRYIQGSPSECFCENPKNLRVSLPPGVIGDPHSAPTCTAAEFATFQCPPESQIGLQGINIALPVQQGGAFALAPIFNLIPSPNQAGLNGFNQPFVPAPIFTVLSARTGSDYGLDATVTGLTQFIPIFNIFQQLWGVPAAPEHADLRFNRGNFGLQCPMFYDPTSVIFNENKIPPPCGSIIPTLSNAPEKAFLSNPTNCAGTLGSTLEVTSYDTEISTEEAIWPAVTGCDQLAFNPTLSAQPTTGQTDTASGLDVNLKVPQSEAPSSPSGSEIKAVRVSMPDGFSINPNAADGKTTCSDEQAMFGSELEAQCPELSKVGTLTLRSPALPGALPGAIYLGDPKPGDRYRLVITADGFATHVKLPGDVQAGPANGDLTVRFENLPQTTFSEFDMHFFGSERGLLATPTECGTYAVSTEFVPWAEELPNQTSTQFFNLNSGPGSGPCPGDTRPLNPSLAAGVTDNNAAAHSTFTLSLSRPDGDQSLDRVDVKLPPGFAATLKGVPYCPPASIAHALGNSGRAEQAAPSCPAASRIGGVVAGAGAGNHPLYVPGNAYLGGPYKGAPLSVVAIVPAVSGPYDLGDVVVQTALQVDPVTARVSARTDPLPKILEGVPLRLRSLLVNLDRPGFVLNPTNCDPFSIETSVFGTEGGVAHPSADFQVANCSILPFSPKLSLRLKGNSKRRGHPALRAVLQTSPGEANLARTVVAMPKNELLDQSHLGNVCTRPQFAAEACPASSAIGTASATTALLDQPLTGNVYLRSNPDRALPDIVADLEGQIDIELAGAVDRGPSGGLRATFAGIPDAPVSKFTLDLAGGKKGLLINSKSLCGKTLKAEVKLVGQNNVRVSRRTELQSDCGKNARRKRHERRAGR